MTFPQMLAGPPSRTHRSCVVVFVDLVESVRLINRDEAGTINRWLDFVARLKRDVLPASTGALVKSLGDGLLLRFDAVPDALETAFAIHACMAAASASVEADQRMLLRIGLHVGKVVVDDSDIYGKAVNLTARLATLAGPSETVISADVVNRLMPDYDAEIEDLGLCYLKHVEEPVRCYRVGPARSVDERSDHRAETSTLPIFAVLPFTSQGSGPIDTLGAVVADDLGAALSRGSALRVISRLSTQPFLDREVNAQQIGRLLQADFVVRGQVEVKDLQVRLSLEVVAVRSGEVIFEHVASARMGNLLDEGAVQALAHRVVASVLAREMLHAHVSTLPNVKGYALLLAAIGRMHSLGSENLMRARELLEHLGERHPRSADVHAWMAKSCFLRIAQAQDGNGDLERSRLRDSLRRALDERPTHGLALALNGHSDAFLGGRISEAERGLRAAIAHEPGEPLAWLYLANVLAAREAGPEAIDAASHALALSPLDPMRYLFETIAATACIAAGRYADAVKHATRSLRLNALHLPALVELIVAQQLAGLYDDARRSARRYLLVRPGASVDRYRQFYPGGGDGVPAQRDAEALIAAGIPK